MLLIIGTYGNEYACWVMMGDDDYHVCIDIVGNNDWS